MDILFEVNTHHTNFESSWNLDTLHPQPAPPHNQRLWNNEGFRFVQYRVPQMKSYF